MARGITESDVHTAAEQSLATQRDALDARSRVGADELSRMCSERAAAIAGERVASTRAAELERLVDQLHPQISELTEQRDLGLLRADRAEAATQHLDARLHEALETARSEREDWTEYVRSVENRTLSDVDRSRREAKDLQAQLNNQAKAQRAIEGQLRKELHAAEPEVDMSVTAQGSPNRCINLLQLSDASWLRRLSPACAPPLDREESPVAHRQWRLNFCSEPLVVALGHLSSRTDESSPTTQPVPDM